MRKQRFMLLPQGRNPNTDSAESVPVSIRASRAMRKASKTGLALYEWIEDLNPTSTIKKSGYRKVIT